jgi:N-acetyl-anhydromuramyl-L-alanine amidase AmpD
MSQVHHISSSQISNMETLELGDTGYDVLSMQKKLRRLGYDIDTDGAFDERTAAAIRDFQEAAALTPDAVVGPKTWEAILSRVYSFSFSKDIYDDYLPVDEYLPELHDKRTIYLHHTAGRHNPYGVRQWWEVDKKELNVQQRRVATAFIIGRRDDEGRGDEHDGEVLRVFDEKYWAYHLGLRTASNRRLNAQAIGIELCNLGPLEEKNGGFWKVWRNKQGEITGEVRIPESEVCDLGREWRGVRFFHKYTEKQLQVCKRLILTLAHEELYDIPIRSFSYDWNWFNLQMDALSGHPGIWTHSNVRGDKTDCFPQPELIDMLNSLHREQEAFVPSLDDPAETTTFDGDKELQYYYESLD